MNFRIRGILVENLSAEEIADGYRQFAAAAIPDAEIDAEVAAREERADEEADVLDDQLPEIISLKEAVSLVPHSESTLRRTYERGDEDSPFWKQGGRLVTTKTDLLIWVRSGDRGPRPEALGDPMPQPCRTAADVLAAIDGTGDR
jgi:hypothetical protein